MEVAPGGGSDAPDPDLGAEHWLFFTGGLATLTLDGTGYEMESGSYAYIPAGSRWTLLAVGKSPARFRLLPGQQAAAVEQSADLAHALRPAADHAAQQAVAAPDLVGRRAFLVGFGNVEHPRSHGDYLAGRIAGRRMAQHGPPAGCDALVDTENEAVHYFPLSFERSALTGQRQSAIVILANR